MKTFAKILLCAVTSLLSARASTAQSTDYQVAKATIMLFNALNQNSQPATSMKLAMQTASIAELQKSIAYLEANELDKAYSNAEKAMISYPKYSLSYLIMAYTALQKGDYLNSQRMLRVYSRYADKEYNKNLSLNVPKEFIELVRAKTEAGMKTLKPEDVRKQYSSEPWLNQTLQIQASTTANAFLTSNVTDYTAGSTNSSGKDAPDFVFENKLGATYKKYFWLSKSSGLPYTANNSALILTTSGEYGFSSPSTYFPSLFYASIQPGLLLHRIYFSIGGLRYYSMPEYSNSLESSGVSQSKLGIFISPEIRLYPGVLNAYATDVRKLSKDLRANAKFQYYYVFLKIGDGLLNATGTSKNGSAYTREYGGLSLGIVANMGKNFGTEYGFAVSYGEQSIAVDQVNSTNYYHFNGEYLGLTLRLAKRIF